MRHFLWTVAVLAAVTASNAHAIAIRCDSCTILQAREKAASAGLGEQYVYSIPTATVRAYNVVNIQGFHEAQPISVPQNIQLAVNGLKEIYQASNGTLKHSVEVPYESLGLNPIYGNDAYAVVRNANLREGILSTRLASLTPPTVSAGVNALIAAAKGIVGLQEGAKVNIVVKFPDESSVTYEYTIGDTHAKYVKNSGRTPSTELIPEENSAAYAGTWYGPTGMGSLVTHLALLTSNVTSTNDGKYIESVRCTWDGHTLKCQVTYHQY